MLALFADLAELSKVGLADVACTANSVARFAEDQILAASLAAFAEHVVCQGRFRSLEALVIAGETAPAWSHSDQFTVGFGVLV